MGNVQKGLSARLCRGPGARACRRERCRTVVEVTDQGIGIASDAQQRIFDPFFRADNAKLESSSFGLGLHVVREIVQHHGSRVEVDSGEGIGSTFRVTLPRRALPV